MKKCSQDDCETLVESNWNFCHECGVRQNKICGVCGQKEPVAYVDSGLCMESYMKQRKEYSVKLKTSLPYWHQRANVITLMVFNAACIIGYSAVLFKDLILSATNLDVSTLTVLSIALSLLGYYSYRSVANSIQGYKVIRKIMKEKYPKLT